MWTLCKTWKGCITILPSSSGRSKKLGNLLPSSSLAYFTVPETDGVDAVSGASRVVTDDCVVGNTELIATEIQKDLGGDLFKIETVQKYPGTHDDLLDFAYKEKADDARPKLSKQIENLDDYDYIFVGYPKMEYSL